MNTLHLVCGLPAVGKTTYGKNLAMSESAAFLDSDTSSNTLIIAAHKAAGIDPHDRDSEQYKQTYRIPVYETLFALALDNLPHTNVVLAGPFTTELKDPEAWKKSLETRFPKSKVRIHHLTLPETERLERMRKRGALRDLGKMI